MKEKNIAFTAWQNDRIILKLWVKYYSQYFDELLVLCFNTQKKYLPFLEGLTKKYNFRYEIVEKYKGDNIDGAPSVFLGLVKDKQEELLKEYKWVLFANCDEIIVADKKYGTLKDLMDKSPQKKLLWICEGYEVIQVRGEKPIDYSKSYFNQRKYWVKNHNYNKIILSKITLNWTVGLHKIEGLSDDESTAFKNTGLYLIHLKHVDLETKRDFGPSISPLDPNIENHWLKYKKPIPDWIKKIL